MLANPELYIHWLEWHAIADADEARAVYLESRGEHAGAWRSKALTARRVCFSFELEQRTGLPHCSCCFRPRGAGHRG